MAYVSGGGALTAANWPIAAAMGQFAGMAADGRSTQEQRPEEWLETLTEVAAEGFTHVDPTDSWLRVADLESARRNEFAAVVAEAGLAIPAISTARRSVIDPKHGTDNLAYSHHVVDAAAK